METYETACIRRQNYETHTKWDKVTFYQIVHLFLLSYVPIQKEFVATEMQLMPHSATLLSTSHLLCPATVPKVKE